MRLGRGQRGVAKLVLFALISILAGLAAAWPLQDLAAARTAAGYALAFFSTLAVFLLLLPNRLTLPLQILVAMLTGGLAGWLATLLGATDFVSDYLGILGTLFILLLKVVILPLIFVSVLCGVAGIGDARKLGSLGMKTVAYFMTTSALAVLTGMLIVQVLDPGAGRAALQEVAVEETATTATLNLGQRVQREVLPSVIQNPIMANQSPIAVIFMAILLGASLAAIRDRGKPALEAFRALDAAFITVIQWVMVLAPLGVFALMARVIAELGIGYVITLGKYCLTVLAGLGAHFAIIVLVLVPLLARVPTIRFLRAMLPAFQLSFSTSSSAATLPVTMQCVTKGAGANPNIAGFVLPIGATINMDGTALYVSVASIFIAQVYGIDLNMQQEILIFLTAVLVSIGTAGIPGASIGLISITLATAGIPVEGLAIVLGVDRLLDMTRTVVNITGDAAGALILSRNAEFGQEGRL